MNNSTVSNNYIKAKKKI